MNWIKQRIKVCIVYALRVCLCAFYIFPIKKRRILFSAYGGWQYACNPKYIFEYLHKTAAGGYEYVWCLNDKTRMPEKYKIRCVRFLSLPHIYYFMTAGVIVSNMDIEPIIPKRKGQLFINTWHGGGAYKKLGIDSPSCKSEIFYLQKMRALRSGMTDWVVSSCRSFTENLSAAFDIDKMKFLPIGMPRNDILYCADEEKRQIRDRICASFNIDAEYMLILYAPTFRGYRFRKHDAFHFDIDIPRALAAAERRFNRKAKLLYRFHVGKTDARLTEGVDATAYPDMQELLAACDILITDYSSSMWDFSLQLRACFLYVPDCSRYLEEHRFYTPFEELPFPAARTNDELEKAIQEFDSDVYVSHVAKHHRQLGSYETGKAREVVCSLIRESDNQSG